jgi:hypothetical protein
MLFYPGAPFSDYYLDKLHGLALAPPRALTFECLGTRHVLRDAKSMAEFLNLINSATSVDRHHSHPLKPCTFQFADDPQIYMLSKDSYIQDEFWLETISDKRSPQDPFNDSIISQFRSSQLRPWLLKHDMELSSEQAPPELIFYYDLHRKALFPPHALTFACRGTQHVIRDASNITTFLNLLTSSTPIRYKLGSHKRCTFQFADETMLYVLSENRANQDEFALDVVDGRPIDTIESHISNQFNSSRLRLWLLQNKVYILGQMQPRGASTGAEPKNPTFPPPTAFGDTKNGDSFALVAHTEPYYTNHQAVVSLWFRTNDPSPVNYFRARSDLKLTVLDPHGVALKVTQPQYMREDRWVSDPGVEIINGEATDVDLNDFCKLGLPGTYTVMATISLANDKGITLTAPPITLQIQDK